MSRNSKAVRQIERAYKGGEGSSYISVRNDLMGRKLHQRVHPSVKEMIKHKSEEMGVSVTAIVLMFQCLAVMERHRDNEEVYSGFKTLLGNLFELYTEYPKTPPKKFLH